MAEISGPVQCVLDVHENRQIAADPHGIHVVEEQCAVAAEQILDVVFGSRDHHVEGGLVHEAIEPPSVKRHVRFEIRWFGLREHDRGSLRFTMISSAHVNGSATIMRRDTDMLSVTACDQEKKGG